MTASLAPSTIKQYSKPLQDWIRYCQDKGINPLEAEECFIIGFLTTLIKNDASYGSVNTAKSAVVLISAQNFSGSKKLSRFLKGAFKLNPSRPRYETTWDIDPVLNKLSSWGPAESLDLPRLTNKFVLLVAIVSSQRLQTLASLRIKNIVKTGKGFEIRVPDILKTSGPGRTQPTIILPRYTKKDLCIASFLERYLEKTEKIRGTEETLFITTRKPFKAATTATLSRWIRSSLAECGVGPEYGAHSTRHASTSAALKKGISLDLIRRAAGWTDESQVFFKYYNRPVESSSANYATGLLDQN